MTEDPLLTPKAVADWLGVTVGMLANWRYMGSGPSFIKLGKSVRYRASDVNGWLTSNTHKRT